MSDTDSDTESVSTAIYSPTTSRSSTLTDRTRTVLPSSAKAKASPQSLTYHPEPQGTHTQISLHEFESALHLGIMGAFRAFNKSDESFVFDPCSGKQPGLTLPPFVVRAQGHGGACTADSKNAIVNARSKSAQPSGSKGLNRQACTAETDSRQSEMDIPVSVEVSLYPWEGLLYEMKDPLALRRHDGDGQLILYPTTFSGDRSLFLLNGSALWNTPGQTVVLTSEGAGGDEATDIFSNKLKCGFATLRVYDENLTPMSTKKELVCLLTVKASDIVQAPSTTSSKAGPGLGS